MPQLKNRRQGSQVLIKNRPLSFSYWPTYKGATRRGLQSTLFALDPWTVITSRVKSDCPPSSKAEALSYVDQARDLFISANSAKITAARPLLLYYCFMNLAKAFIIHASARQTMIGSQHGLSEQMRSGGKELIDALLEAYPSPNPRTKKYQIFDDFLVAMRQPRLSSPTRYALSSLLPQIVPGHRLWAQAVDKDERFLAIHEIRLLHNKRTKCLWPRLYLFNDDLTRLGVTHSRLIQESDLSADFSEVKSTRTVEKRRLVCLEKNQAVQYKNGPADQIHQIVDSIRRYLWVTVASVPPYRRYYLYLAPSAERTEVLPQLLSIYAITYYLSSITRYRPHHFDQILDSPYGARIEEFITGQPSQFVYLMASEFAKQEVTRPSIV